MKTFIGALIGIVVIVLIVVLARSGRSQAPAADTVNTPTSAPTQPQPTTPSTAAQAPAVASAAVTQPNGLQYTVTQTGTGVAAKDGDLVSVNYTGMLTNGTVFDSNVDPKFGHVQPFQFTLGAGNVIAGWDQGVLGMKVGETRHLVIPAALGYGAAGAAGGAIPPNATLVFDVTVTAIAPGSN